MNDRSTIDFLGVRIDSVDTTALRKRVVEFASDGKQHKVMYINADCMLLTMRDSDYRDILNRADLVYADGIGVVLGARLWGYRLPGRSTAADFFPDFCKEFANLKLKLFLLGGKEGVAEEAAAKLVAMAPDLRIVGTHHGYFKMEETNRIIESINATEPHILVIGLGVPLQEKWMDVNLQRLHANVIWGVGGLFDFVSGRTWRGPQWLLDHGFEWLCRLIAEPHRLAGRYLIGNSRFILHLLWRRFISSRQQ